MTNRKIKNGEVIASAKDMPLILVFSKAMHTNAIQGTMKYRTDLIISFMVHTLLSNVLIARFSFEGRYEAICEMAFVADH